MIVKVKSNDPEINGAYIDTIRHKGTMIEISPGWISVKDRLPEEEGTYLVVQQSPIRDVTLAWFSGNENGWLALDGSFYEDGIITYYMPLPEPPKEEI